MVCKYDLYIQKLFAIIFLSGKTTFIHYVANYFANKHSFNDRLSQTAFELTKQETIWSSSDLEKTYTYTFSRYSFPIDNQTSLVFLDCPLHILDASNNEDDFMKPLIDLYGINHFATVIMIMDGTVIKENLDWNNFKPNNLFELFEGSQKFPNLFEHFLLVFPNCSSHALDINCSALNTCDNLSVYFMQNAAYQLYRAPSITDSVEIDYHRSMETMGRIIKKIVDGIHFQAQNKLTHYDSFLF